MVRGVNKKVIEINHPDSIYFERAVLYLRPDVTEVTLQAAQTEADGYFGDSGRQCRFRLRGWLVFLLGMITSAAVGIGVELLIR